MAIGKDILAAMAIRIGIDSANFSKSLNKIQGDMNIWKSGLKELGKVVAGVFAVDTLVQFGKESFREYQAQYRAERILLTALKGRGDVQERLIAQASYLQTKTLFSDDEIINQQRLLASLGLTESQIKNVINAATNLATALGIDLQSASLMLAKTYSGTTREIGRLVPEIKNMTKEQLAAGKAIEWVDKNMKGLAETAGDTDPIAQNAKAWGEFRESFGKWLAGPAGKTLSKWNEWLLLRSQPDLTVWDKWVIDLSNAGRHKLYEEMQMKLLKESSEDVQKAWEKIEKSYLNVLSKNNGPSPLLSPEDQKAIAEKLNPKTSASAVVPQIPLLEAAKTKLQEYKDAFEASLTEQELTKWGRLVEIQTQEVQRLEDMGKAIKYLSSEEIKQSLADMAASVSGIIDTGFTPIAKPGRVGPMVENKSGGVTVGPNSTTLNFPEEKKKWKDHFDFIVKTAEMAKEQLAAVNSAIEQGLENMVAGFAESLGQMMAGQKKFDTSFILESLGELATSLGKLLIGFGIAGIGLKKLITNPYLAVAAGAALVALGAAAKSAAGNMINGEGSASGSSYGGTTGGTQNENFSFQRNMGDASNIPIHMTGEFTVRGEDLRLALNRATVKHNSGY